MKYLPENNKLLRLKRTVDVENRKSSALHYIFLMLSLGPGEHLLRIPAKIK
jgi:hypothetical protein